MIDGQPIQMELDTGAAVSVMPQSTFAQLKHQPPLKQTTVKLKTFSGELMKPIGVAAVKVDINGQSAIVDLYITKTGINPLFGRSWLRKLKINWSEIKNLHTASRSTHDKLKDLLAKHENVFKDEIGDLKGFEA